MKLNTSTLLYAAGIAGGAAGLLSSIPLVNFVNCLLCGWLWIGGIAAVYLYNNRESVSLPAAQGALVGGVAGIIASLVGAVLGLLLGGFGVAATSLSDPEIAQYLDQFGGADAVAGFATTFGLLCGLILYGGFGALGGVIGASLFKKK
jgi:hypothetical protein